MQAAGTAGTAAVALPNAAPPQPLTPAPPPASAPSTPFLQLLEVYRLCLAALAQAQGAQVSSALAATLFARDQIARHLAEPHIETADALLQLVALDKALKSAAKGVEGAIGVRGIRQLAAAAEHDQQGWWWKLDQYLPRPSFLWTAVAAVLIATTVSLAAEIVRRFLSEGPDFWGALYTPAQTGLTLLAGSAFIGKTAEGLLDRWGLRRRWHAPLLTVFALAVFGVALGAFWGLPYAARVYVQAGVSRMERSDFSIAIQDFRRALSLSPDFPQAHYNIGRAYELVLDYDGAAPEYQKAIQGDPRMYQAYNSLAHLYIVQKGDASGALGLINEALTLTENDRIRSPAEVSQARFALLKNRGWANLLSGNYAQARSDLGEALKIDANAASPHCLLAQVEEKQSRPADLEWGLCLGYSYGAPDVEPIWRAMAEDRIRRTTEVTK